MNKSNSLALGYVLVLGTLVLVSQWWWRDARHVAPLPYSRFEELLAQGQIASVAVGGQTLEGSYNAPDADGHTRFVTQRVEPGIAAQLAAHHITFWGLADHPLWRDLLSWLMPVVFFFGFWWFAIRRLAEHQGLGGVLTAGRTKARLAAEPSTGVTFDDVAGVDEAKRELQEIVEFLRNPKHYGRLGARIPKGVLLVGPPGTGKTLLARAVAGQAGVPFYSLSGAEFVELFVGVGAARVRDLFEQARRTAPSIIFIDELDALGRARGFGPFGGHDEKEQTLNQLLSELDGFDPSLGVVLLGATNRPEILDPALLRAGRFDRQVLVDRPDKRGREQILAVHVKKVRLAPEVNLERVAALTPGFTGADLANLVNEAALLATRRDAEAVSEADLVGAMERIVAGVEQRSRVIGEAERRAVACHEIGHALVAMSLPGIDPVQKVSIIPRSVGALGYTLQRPTEDRFLLTRQHLKDRMAVLMGGRAAEQLMLGEFSTGAADDLDKVTEIARQMAARYGMSETLGQVVYEEPHARFLADVPLAPGNSRGHGEATARELDLAVRTLVDEAFARASAILTRRRADLEAGASTLFARETLTADELPFTRES